jgi:hypothetical protein
MLEADSKPVTVNEGTGSNRNSVHENANGRRETLSNCRTAPTQAKPGSSGPPVGLTVNTDRLLMPIDPQLREDAHYVMLNAHWEAKR